MVILKGRGYSIALKVILKGRVYNMALTGHSERTGL